MATMATPITVRGICDAYRTGSERLRGLLREMYRGLRLEFDAIDVEEERLQRIGAFPTGT